MTTPAQENLLETLRKNEWTLQQLAAASSIAITDLSEQLVALSEKGLVERRDGRWKRVEAGISHATNPATPLVIVDLGNVHDCLQRLAPLAEAECVEVWAYADLHYNGFGIQPPLRSKGVRVEQARVTHKNAADTKLIWDLALFCKSSAPRTIFIATKDNGFRHLQELAEQLGHRVVFCENWASFKASFEA